MKRTLLLFIVIVTTKYSYAQFTLNPTISDQLDSIAFSSLDIADYDGDGDLDILVAGLWAQNGGIAGVATQIYRNDNGNYTNIEAPLLGVWGVARWGDFDNDGDMDLIAAGEGDNTAIVSKIYRNDNGTFVDTNANIKSLKWCDADWGDFDNDGDDDLLFSGIDGQGDSYSIIYESRDGAFIDINAGLTNLNYGSADWGDFNNDGWLDVLLTGENSETGVGLAYTKLYRQVNGIFIEEETTMLNLTGGDAEFADYDHDGDLDILLIGLNGYTDPPIYTKIYRNDNGQFVDIEANLQGLYDGFGTFGDFDGDFDLDLLITGTEDAVIPVTKIYRNDDGTFTELITTVENFVGEARFADMDQDFDLDLVMSGADSEYVPFTEIYDNDLNPTYVIWDGISWSSGEMPVWEHVIIDGDYTIPANDFFVTKSLKVTSGNTLTISGQCQLFLDGDVINNGTINVAPASSLVISSVSTFLGNPINMEIKTRYGDGRYSFVGSMMKKSPTLFGSDLGSVVYQYNEAIGYDLDDGLSRWENAASQELVPGKGYAQAFKDTITFTGIPNEGIIGIHHLSHSVDGTTNEADRGWNLIANPFPTAGYLQHFFTTNPHIDGMIALWDDPGSDLQRGSNADYLIVNQFGAVGASPNGGQWDGNIHPGQGFFIRVTNPTEDTSVVFDRNFTAIAFFDNSGFFRTSDEKHSQWRIQLSNENDQIAETLIIAHPEATNDKDRLFDAIRLKGRTDLQLYTYINDQPYAIQGIPDIENESTVPLGVDLGAGWYELRLTDEDPNYEAWLYDRSIGQYINLSEAGYQFHSGEVINDDRFHLLISATGQQFHTGLAGHMSLGIKDQVLELRSQLGTKKITGRLAVHTISGRKVTEYNNITVSPDHPWKSNVLNYEGIAIITFQSDDQSNTWKILMR